MTFVSSPNGLLIASALFALSGLAVLVRAFYALYSAPSAASDKTQQKSEAQVAAWFGLPMLAASFFLSGAGQFAAGPLGVGLTCLLLALAFTLLLYVMMEGSFADTLTLANRSGVATETARRPVAQPPKLIAVEAHEENNLGTDATRQALPA